MFLPPVVGVTNTATGSGFAARESVIVDLKHFVLLSLMSRLSQSLKAIVQRIPENRIASEVREKYAYQFLCYQRPEAPPPPDEPPPPLKLSLSNEEDDDDE